MNAELTGVATKAAKQAAAGIGLPTAGGLAGAGVVLLTIAACLMWKNHKTPMGAYKSAGIMAFLSGLCLAGLVAGYVGNLFGYTILGVGVTTVGLLASGIFYIAEMRGHGHHAVRTPILGFAFAVFLASAGGALGTAVGQAQNGVVNSVNTVTNSTVGGK